MESTLTSPLTTLQAAQARGHAASRAGSYSLRIVKTKKTNTTD